MRNRILLGAAVVAAGAFAAVPVVSGAASAPSTARFKITGGATYKINRYVQDNLRYSADAVRIKSGGTVTLVNTVGDDEGPHTLSIERARDIPRTTSQINNCFPKGICGKVGAAHQFPEGDGPPKKPLVNVGAAGFNTVGDSIVIFPSKTVKFKVTARAGTTLHFFCAVHPWMQGRFIVG